MKVLHLAAGNRWTGAAAPAFAETEALREAGVDAHYAYVGGYKLQAKIGHFDFGHPVIGKAQNPISFVRTVEAIERLIRHHSFDIVHAHLTYDHWLARFAARDSRAHLARTFHARRVLRNEPFTRSLVAHTDVLFVTNDTLAAAPVLRGRNVILTPPPLDQRQFTPDGPDARARYSIPPNVPVLSAIGKLSADRGFEDVINVFDVVRRQFAEARLMIIGHGEHRPSLEALTHKLGLESNVIWAGYQETDLAEHYRAADILLFTARGSDEGHRAMIEAMGCGLIPVAYPLPGVASIAGDLRPAIMSAEAKPASLAVKVGEILSGNTAELRRRAYEHSKKFGYRDAADRLIRAYSAVI